MYKLFFDGSKKQNIITYGYIIYLDEKEIIKFSSTIQNASRLSNNFAEYIALIIGLKHALILNINEIEIFGDSKTIIDQINKKVCAKSIVMRYCRDCIWDTCKFFDFIKFNWIPRKYNKGADRLCR